MSRWNHATVLRRRSPASAGPGLRSDRRILSFSVSLLMVLVARRITELWWFAWAFVIATAGCAIVATLNALFGLPDGAPLLWGMFAAVSTAFTVGQLAGQAKTGSERPPLQSLQP